MKDQVKEIIKQWSLEVAGYSFLFQKIRNPLYKKILQYDKDELVPILLEILNENPIDYSFLLIEITKTDPVVEWTSYEDLVDKWREWGKKRGYYHE